MTSQAGGQPDFVAMYERGVASTRNYLANVKPDQWNSSTPCDKWDVRALANHIVGGGFMTKAVIEHAPLGAPGDVLGTDPLAAFDAAAAGAMESFKAAGALEGNVKAPWGEMPAAVFVFSMFQDIFIHGWDLAKATGQDTTLNTELVEMNYAIALPSKDMIRSSGTFGPSEVPVAAEADTQSKLLGMLGRRA